MGAQQCGIRREPLDRPTRRDMRTHLDRIDGQRKSRLLVGTPRGMGSMRSARTLMTSPWRSSTPRTSSAGAPVRHPAVAGPAPLGHDDVDEAGLVLEVDERDALGGGRALAVGDHPADEHLRAVGTTSSAAARRSPRRGRSSSSRQNRVGWPSGDTPVAHRSATASSRGSMPGSVGASAPVTMPARRPGVDWATAPACHSASRRSSAEALLEGAGGGEGLEVGEGEVGHPAAEVLHRGVGPAGGDRVGQLVADAAHRADAEADRRARPRPTGRAARPRSAIAVPVSVSRVAPAAEALRSGVRTSTPWRRASCTSECGE